MKPIVKGFFDPATWTVSYVVYEKEGGGCAIVDSVLDYDPKSGRTRTTSADQLIAFVQEKQPQGAMDPGDPCPCRPPVGRASPAPQAGRQDRHRRGHHPGAGRVQAHLQPRSPNSAPTATSSTIC
jgi:hypothetical protein